MKVRAVPTLIAALAATSAPASATEPVFRLAFSAAMFTEVNEADARAAMKVWITTVARDRGIGVDANPNICGNAEELAQFCRANPVSGVGLLVSEFPRLNEEMKFDRFAVGMKGDRIDEEYVLLVRADSGIVRLEALRGRSLVVLLNPRMSLAIPWLDTVLFEAGLPGTRRFFGSVSHSKKASQVALPVFFRQTEACLLTRAALEVMGELNPQVQKQLRVVAQSPAYVPSGFAFRAVEDSATRSRILEEMTRLGDTAAGRQILALTQADHIVDRPISCLDSALELLARHRRLQNDREAAGAERPLTQNR